MPRARSRSPLPFPPPFQTVSPLLHVCVQRFVAWRARPAGGRPQPQRRRNTVMRSVHCACRARKRLYAAVSWTHAPHRLPPIAPKYSLRLTFIPHGLPTPSARRRSHQLRQAGSRRRRRAKSKGHQQTDRQPGRVEQTSRRRRAELVAVAVADEG